MDARGVLRPFSVHSSLLDNKEVNNDRVFKSDKQMANPLRNTNLFD
jgi:hypothetical protein